MDTQTLKAQILAVLFAAGRPLALGDLSPLGTEDALLRAIVALEHDLSDGKSGVQLERVAGGWRLVVHPLHLTAVEQVLRPTPPRISKAALEVLALIAYQQPLTRAELEALRGKSVEGGARGTDRAPTGAGSRREGSCGTAQAIWNHRPLPGNVRPGKPSRPAPSRRRPDFAAAQLRCVHGAKPGFVIMPQVGEGYLL